jgi:hypothetical protein
MALTGIQMGPRQFELPPNMRCRTPLAGTTVNPALRPRTVGLDAVLADSERMP